MDDVENLQIKKGMELLERDWDESVGRVISKLCNNCENQYTVC